MNKNKIDLMFDLDINIILAKKVKKWKHVVKKAEDYDETYYVDRKGVRFYHWSPTHHIGDLLDATKGHRIRLSNKSSNIYWWAYVDDAIAQDRNPLRAICKALLMTLEKKKKC